MSVHGGSVRSAPGRRSPLRRRGAVAAPGLRSRQRPPPRRRCEEGWRPPRCAQRRLLPPRRQEPRPHPRGLATFAAAGALRPTLPPRPPLLPRPPRRKQRPRMSNSRKWTPRRQRRSSRRAFTPRQASMLRLPRWRSSGRRTRASDGPTDTSRALSPRHRQPVRGSGRHARPRRLRPRQCRTCPRCRTASAPGRSCRVRLGRGAAARPRSSHLVRSRRRSPAMARAHPVAMTSAAA